MMPLKVQQHVVSDAGRSWSHIEANMCFVYAARRAVRRSKYGNEVVMYCGLESSMFLCGVAASKSFELIHMKPSETLFVVLTATELETDRETSVFRMSNVSLRARRAKTMPDWMLKLCVLLGRQGKIAFHDSLPYSIGIQWFAYIFNGVS